MNLACNYTDTFSGHQYLVNCVGNKEPHYAQFDKDQYKDNFPMLLTQSTQVFSSVFSSQYLSILLKENMFDFEWVQANISLILKFL